MRIGYARVSTDEQNLDLQINALMAAGCTHVYADDGVSAVARERPEFAAALAALGPGDTLVIWKMDRAFRSLLHSLRVLEQLEACGVEFQSLTEAIDTATPMGRFAYQVRNAVGEFERALIIERTKAGMDAARRRGAAIGRPRKLTAEQVDEARQRLASGDTSLVNIADELDVAPRTLSRALARTT